MTSAAGRTGGELGECQGKKKEGTEERGGIGGKGRIGREGEEREDGERRGNKVGKTKNLLAGRAAEESRGN